MPTLSRNEFNLADNIRLIIKISRARAPRRAPRPALLYRWNLSRGAWETFHGNMSINRSEDIFNNNCRWKAEENYFRVNPFRNCGTRLAYLLGRIRPRAGASCGRTHYRVLEIILAFKLLQSDTARRSLRLQHYYRNKCWQLYTELPSS